MPLALAGVGGLWRCVAEPEARGKPRARGVRRVSPLQQRILSAVRRLGHGPRFLIPALPFVALGIAAALRAMPLTTLALAAPSVVAMGATLASSGGAGPGAGLWLERWRGSDFTETVVTRAGGETAGRPSSPCSWRSPSQRPRSVHASADRAPGTRRRSRARCGVPVDRPCRLGPSCSSSIAPSGSRRPCRGRRVAPRRCGLVARPASLWDPRGGRRAVLASSRFRESSHSKWALLVVVGSAVIVAVTFVRLEPRT